MNILLLTPKDHVADNLYRVDGRRFHHITNHLKLGIGETLRSGLLNQEIGVGLIAEVAKDHLVVAFSSRKPALAATNITLLLALPRPKMLKRILIDATTLGIKHIILLNSYKVDKSYWSTPELHQQLLQEKLLLGLEQAGDTHLPSIQLEKRFKPFIEDRLPTLAQGRLKLLADPGNHPALPAAIQQPAVLAIGPEGGWTDYERERLIECGFQAYSLGERILRVETAVSSLVGRLLPG